LILGFFYHFGRYLLWHKSIFQKTGNFAMYYREIIRQMYDIGIGSLSIVFIISIFIGAVTAQQMFYQLSGTAIPTYYIGYIVRDMTIIELAATITCLVLAGKVGSNMAAEIGGMRQKEHIDAMEIMGVNTSSFLILPKIIGGVITIPILVCIAAIVSIIGGYLASVPTGLFTELDYVKGLRAFFVPFNVFMMFVKALVFSYIITSVSCYQGFFVKGGSVELGQASTRAVVYSSVLILVADYIIAVVLTSY
jgi:phospholipid/cholesterol/gamma-HCH transport system permease protein